MAVRSATRRYPDLLTFLREYPTTLKQGFLVLPPDALDGEPAPELRLDLMLPLLGRVGPIQAQVIQRLPDGGAALKLPQLTPDVSSAIDKLLMVAEQARQWLLETNQVLDAEKVSSKTIDELRAQVQLLEAELHHLRAGPAPSGAVISAPTAQKQRGFPLIDVRGMKPALSGTLTDRSLRDAFMALAVERQTGLLLIRYESGRTRFGYWYKGGPVGWRTEPMDEQEVLGTLLFRANQVTKEQIAQSLEIMEHTGCRQGEALIEMGVLSYPQLVLLLQKQTEFILQRVMKDREGSWFFYLLDQLPERFITPPVRVSAFLFRALRVHAREMPLEELSGSLKPHLDFYVFLAPDVEKTIEDMKLSTEEQQFVKILTSTSYRLRELFRVSNLSRSYTAALMWAFSDLKLVEYRAEQAQSRINDKLEKLVSDRKRQIEKGTMFDRLDLHWICTKTDVEAAWNRVSQELSPQTLAAYDVRYRAELEKMLPAMQAAYELLIDDAKRREYRRQIVEKVTIDHSADILLRKGEMAIVKGNAREAVECFTKATDLWPNSTQARDGLVRAKAISLA